MQSNQPTSPAFDQSLRSRERFTMSMEKKRHRDDAEGPPSAKASKKQKTWTKTPGAEDDADALRAEKKRRKDEKREKKARKAERKEHKKAEKQAKKAKHAEEKTERKAEADKAQDAGRSYRQTRALDAVPEAEVQAFLATHHVTIADPLAERGAPALRPILVFDHLPASALVAQKPFAAFAAPTPIQAAAWPFALGGRDMIGIAETGSGKTVAFALPCIEALAATARPGPPGSAQTPVRARAVVVSPTRELAMQTHVALAALAQRAGLSATCLYGGASKDEQRRGLRAHGGADVVVATPGRLRDLLAEGCLTLDAAAFVVLDEADRMLDKGFEEDIRQILGQCPPRGRRQTLMFTATWPASVRGLAEGYMVDPVKVTIGQRARVGDEGGGGGDGGGGGVELQANSRIEQLVEVVEPRAKEQRVLQLLREAQQGKARDDRILVFCLYKKEAVRVEQFLQGRGVRVASIHGDLSQDRRTQSLEAFKAGTTPVLVATDVAARGLDIPEVKLVINVTVRTGPAVAARARVSGFHLGLLGQQQLTLSSAPTSSR